MGKWTLTIVVLLDLAFLIGWLMFCRWVLRRRRAKKVVNTYEDVLRECLKSGKMVIGNRRDDGGWDVEEIPLE